MMDENFKIKRKTDRKGTDQEKADSKKEELLLIPDVFQDESFTEWTS